MKDHQLVSFSYPVPIDDKVGRLKFSTYAIYKSTSDGKHKVRRVKFGNKNYEDFTMHQNEQKKKQYMAKIKNTGKMGSQRWFHLNLCWNKPTMKEAFMDTLEAILNPTEEEQEETYQDKKSANANEECADEHVQCQ